MRSRPCGGGCFLSRGVCLRVRGSRETSTRWKPQWGKVSDGSAPGPELAHPACSAPSTEWGEPPLRGGRSLGGSEAGSHGVRVGSGEGAGLQQAAPCVCGSRFSLPWASPGHGPEGPRKQWGSEAASRTEEGTRSCRQQGALPVVLYSGPLSPPLIRASPRARSPAPALPARRQHRMPLHRSARIAPTFTWIKAGVIPQLSLLHLGFTLSP